MGLLDSIRNMFSSRRPVPPPPQNYGPQNWNNNPHQGGPHNEPPGGGPHNGPPHGGNHNGPPHSGPRR